MFKSIRTMDPGLEQMLSDETSGCKIVVTGGRGFIGHNLVKRLLDKTGASIDVLDDGSTGKNHVGFADAHRVNYVDIDINDVTAMQDYMRKVENDDIVLIFNLACAASPIHYQAEAMKTIATNTVGVMNVATLARLHRATVVQASTSEVYGDPEAPFLESQSEHYTGNVNNLGPRACYDNGKRMAETILWESSNRGGFPLRIARIFNTFGPYMDPRDGRVVSNFIMASLQGQPHQVYGDGTSNRSFCYVDDLVDGLIALSVYDIPSGTAVNLGNNVQGSNMTIKRLSDLVNNVAGTESKMQFVASLPDDPRSRNPNTDLAMTYLGWQPEVSLTQAMARTVEYFRLASTRAPGKIDE